MKAVYGAVSATGSRRSRRSNRLRAAGIADREITVISAQPMEDYEFGHIDKATWHVVDRLRRRADRDGRRRSA